MRGYVEVTAGCRCERVVLNQQTLDGVPGEQRGECVVWCSSSGPGPGFIDCMAADSLLPL